jgi:NADPH-dependent 2,4-dienoyl-CoA reductase/sulfur reductase-like enzyme
MRPRVVVVGNGMAGMRAAERVVRLYPDASVAVDGDEESPAPGPVRTPRIRRRGVSLSAARMIRADQAGGKRALGTPTCPGELFSGGRVRDV